jgi:DNA-binding transcriptional LysR family regulator
MTNLHAQDAASRGVHANANRLEILCAFGMTLDLAYLLDFKALAETGSFSRAAFVRNVTQPAFSRRIRALEDWAGAPLFQRGTTPVTLTDAGRAIGPAFQQAMLLLTQGQADAQAAAARSASSLPFRGYSCAVLHLLSELATQP